MSGEKKGFYRWLGTMGYKKAHVEAIKQKKEANKIYYQMKKRQRFNKIINKSHGSYPKAI